MEQTKIAPPVKPTFDEPNKESIEQIKADVRLVIDESEDNSELLAAFDPITIETDNITESMILQSIDEVHKSAQLYMLVDVRHSEGLSLTAYRKGHKAYIPDDFLRFVCADCADWERTVYDPIDQDSDEYMMQSSKWAGVRGTTERPVVAIIPGPDALQMEVYTTGANTVNLTYIKKAGIDQENKVEIASMCYRALLYTIAKYYLISTGNNQQAAIMGAVATQMIGAQQPQAAQE